jgi:hypothetical protein
MRNFSTFILCLMSTAAFSKDPQGMVTSNFTGRNQSIDTIKSYNSSCINTLLTDLENSGCVFLYHAGDVDGSVFSCSKSTKSEVPQEKSVLLKTYTSYRLDYWGDMHTKFNYKAVRCQDDSHVIYQAM